MRLTLISTFRNATPYLERYFDQIGAFQEQLGTQEISLKLLLGYGDSKDKTGEVLYEECAHRFDATLVDVSHGGPNFGSVVHPQRFRQLAGIGNTLWNLIPKGTDVVGLVESDLIWEASTLVSLLDNLERFQELGCKQVMVAPLVLHQDGRFYDTYAFRKDYVNFGNQEPFHAGLATRVNYMEMDSVGSCFFTDIRTARLVTWPQEDVVVGLCRQAREAGTRIFLLKNLKVYHP